MEPTRVMKLYWKKFLPTGQAPTVAHAGEDLAYDLYAAESVLLTRGQVQRVRTGIAIEFDPARGALIRDRSSMASKGVYTTGGVVDAGYRGEVMVLLTLEDYPPLGVLIGGKYLINTGEKIAQMIPIVPDTMFIVEETDVLKAGGRGEKGFGSSGK